MDASDYTAPAMARAQWLSELIRAIDEAQWLAWRIGVVEGRNAQALELYVRLELVRTEVEALKRFRMPANDEPASPLDALWNLSAAGKGLEE